MQRLTGIGDNADIERAKSAMISLNDAEYCFKNRLSDLSACFKEKATANERNRLMTLALVGAGAFLVGRYVLPKKS